jgi:hypothetical protein
MSRNEAVMAGKILWSMILSAAPASFQVRWHATQEQGRRCRDSPISSLRPKAYSAHGLQGGGPLA